MWKQFLKRTLLLFSPKGRPPMQIQSYEIREAPDHQSTLFCGTEGQPPYCVTSSGQPSPRATESFNAHEVFSSKTKHRREEGKSLCPESEKKALTTDPQMNEIKSLIGKVHIWPIFSKIRIEKFSFLVAKFCSPSKNYFPKVRQKHFLSFSSLLDFYFWVENASVLFSNKNWF